MAAMNVGTLRELLRLNDGAILRLKPLWRTATMGTRGVGNVGGSGLGAPKMTHSCNSCPRSSSVSNPMRDNANANGARSTLDSDQPFVERPWMLVDSFGRHHNYLRLSLTEKCNFRCTYCMPADGVDLTPQTELLTMPETLRLIRLFVSGGVDKVRLTGGEPLLRQDLPQITKALQSAGVCVTAITTNGLLLERRREELTQSGISSFNVSIDTLHPERFHQLSRMPAIYLDRVLKGAYAAIAAADKGEGAKVKINMVVMRGINDDEITSFVDKFALGGENGGGPTCNVRFIEYMPFDSNGWEISKMVPQRELKESITAHLERRGGFQLRKADTGISAVGRDYDIVRGTNVFGRVSFVSSMTDNFCSGCNRIRLLADGALKVCLFGNEEVNLRDMMRNDATDDDIASAIHQALLRKEKQHAGMSRLGSLKNRPMIKIGG